MNERPELLVASVSRDPLVLAKLLGTLEPRRVLLFTTPHACQQGWQDHASRVAELVRSQSQVDFEYLEDGDWGAQHDQMHRAITKTFAAIREDRNVDGQTLVALDAATGHGIHRFLIYEIIRGLAAQHRYQFLIVYCDPDTTRMVVANVGGAPRRLESFPIRFPFARDRSNIEARLQIYSTRHKVKHCAWQDGLRYSDLELRCLESFSQLLSQDEMMRRRVRAASPHIRNAQEKKKSLRGLPDYVKVWLNSQRGDLTKLFERWLAFTVAKIIDEDNSLRKEVASVYEGVVVRSGEQTVAEFDTLVLLRTGDLIEFEAKKSPSSIQRKDMESRVKQLRDYCGGYSKYALVLPMTEDEIKRESRNWGHYKKALLQGRERLIGIVGIDRIADALALTDLTKLAESRTWLSPAPSAKSRRPRRARRHSGAGPSTRSRAKA